MKAAIDTRIQRGKASLLHLNIMQIVPKEKKDIIRPMLDEMLQIVDELGEELEKQKTKRMIICGRMTLCARLVCVLSDTLDGIMKELDRLDGIEIQTGAPDSTPAKGGMKVDVCID